MNESGTPTTPVTAKVATTAPASTVIGADAETVKNHMPPVPRLPRSSPLGALRLITPPQALKYPRTNKTEGGIAFATAPRRSRLCTEREDTVTSGGWIATRPAHR